MSNRSDETSKNGNGPTGGETANPGAADSALREGPESSAYKPKYTPLWNNMVTMAGIFLAVTGFLGLLTFALFNLVAPAGNPYVDIVGYLVMPGILVSGLIVIPLGILYKSWRVHRRDPNQKLTIRFPRIDLNDPIQRKAAKVVVAGTFILLPAVGVSSYHGYHFTDSTEFCSQVCHSVMAPEATTYAQSGHARVACAECHIGSGASWFVKSKLSGTRQVIAMWRKSYSRPIPPAIQELRPARETCEQCHWPAKFFGEQLAVRTRFAPDEANTRREINMLLKTGGGSGSSTHLGGIHWHIALEGHIEFVATDDRLQEIPWVKMTDYVGQELVYRSDGHSHADPPPPGELRRMDCMDCHNRSAHKFRAPSNAVDIALRDGNIDPTLPYIKREAVAALVRPYIDAESAKGGIATAISEFYHAKYPKVVATHKAAIEQAISTIQDIYGHSFFSTMNVDWRTYPDSIGHKFFPGCFRCHDGRHVDQFGEKISHECHTCHTFLSPLERKGEASLIQEGDFIHPMKLEGPHAELRCDRCHTGGVAPSPTCAECHTRQTAFIAGTAVAFEEFHIVADPMADVVGCTDCHDLSKPTTIEAIAGACADCHDDPEYRTRLADWKKEVDSLMAEVEPALDEPGRQRLQELREAGPYHNIEATRTILKALGGSAQGTTTATSPASQP